MPEMDWSDHPKTLIPGVQEEDISFDKPSLLECNPHGRQAGNIGPDDTPQDLPPYPCGKRPNSVDDDLDVDDESQFGCVGADHSVPYHGKHCEMDDPCDKNHGDVDNNDSSFHHKKNWSQAKILSSQRVLQDLPYFLS